MLAAKEIAHYRLRKQKRFPSLSIVYCLSVSYACVDVFFLFLSCLSVVQLHGARASVGLAAQPAGLWGEQHAAVNARKDHDVLQRQYYFV